MGLHQLGRLVAVVVLVGGAIGVDALGEDEDVLAKAEGITEDRYGLEVDVGVLARGLAGRRTIEVPGGKVVGLVLLLGESLERNNDVSVNVTFPGCEGGLCSYPCLGTSATLRVDPVMGVSASVRLQTWRLPCWQVIGFYEVKPHTLFAGIGLTRCTPQ